MKTIGKYELEDLVAKLNIRGMHSDAEKLRTEGRPNNLSSNALAVVTAERNCALAIHGNIADIITVTATTCGRCIRSRSPRERGPFFSRQRILCETAASFSTVGNTLSSAKSDSYTPSE